MTTYTAIANNEIDEDSEITTGLMTKLRDNPIAITEGSSGAPKIQTAALEQTNGSEAVTTATIRAGAVGQTEIATGAVHQDKIDTSTEQDSTTNVFGQLFVLTGGMYTLGFNAWTNTTGDVEHVEVSHGIHSGPFEDFSWSGSATQQAYAFIDAGIAGGTSYTAYCDTRYILSSPPYNMGDGEIPLFCWAAVDNNGVILSMQTSVTPPWAYNGPTDIRPDKTIRTSEGIKKIKIIKSIDENTGEITEREQEIDHAYKNRDMDTIPHPFPLAKSKGFNVVLIDPPDSLQLRDIADAKMSVNELFHGDYLRIDNSPISRVTPRDVIVAKYKWKDTQRKAGAMIKDKRLKQGPYAPEVIDG